MDKDALNGMYWDIGSFDFQIPRFDSTQKAVFIFDKNLAEITWNSLRVLENNPSTLPQTQTILKGQSVAGLSIDELMQVKHYGEGARELVRLLRSSEFDLTQECACAIHNYVGREEALEWGVFRSLTVGIESIAYAPPQAAELEGLAKQGFSFLKQNVADPRERAVAVFLFMARSQFFFDANKRTASLMMNGCLMQSGYWPITVLNRNAAEFHTRLREFYESGNAYGMMKLFERLVRDLYPQAELRR